MDERGGGADYMCMSNVAGFYKFYIAHMHEAGKRPSRAEPSERQCALYLIVFAPKCVACIFDVENGGRTHTHTHARLGHTTQHMSAVRHAALRRRSNATIRDNIVTIFQNQIIRTREITSFN